MKDIDIDNAIENVDFEKKERMRAQLHARIGLPQQKEQQKKSKRRISHLKAVAFGIVGMCAVCLAIVLPMSLRNNAPMSSPKRYTYNAADFANDDLGLTIKDYAEQTGKNILFLDWYDIADECVTTKYFLPDKQDNIIYIAEDILNGETGDHVRIDVVDINTNIDELDAISEICKLDYEYNSTKIKWAPNTSASQAYFAYNGYKYYVRLDYPMSDQAILDIVKEMF